MSRQRQIPLRKMTFFSGTFSQHSYYRLFLKKNMALSMDGVQLSQGC